MNKPASHTGLGMTMNASFLGFFAHCGFLAGLRELNVRPAKIAGASAGAIAAALHAVLDDTEKIKNILFDRDLQRHFLEKRALLKWPAMFIGRRGRAGAMSGDKVHARFREILGDHQIEDLADPQLALAVTNLTNSRSELITKGDLVDYLVASFAFPGIFASRRIGDCDYWDGGIARPTPIMHWAIDDSIDTVLVHRVKSGEDEEAVKRGNFSAAMHLAHVAAARDLYELRRERVEAAGKQLIEIQTKTPRLGILHRFERRVECYELGLETARSNAVPLAKLAI